MTYVGIWHVTRGVPYEIPKTEKVLSLLCCGAANHDVDDDLDLDYYDAVVGDYAVAPTVPSDKHQ